MHDITDVSIKVQETAEHTPPVPYDEDLPTNSELAKIIVKDGCQNSAINKKLLEFYKILEMGLKTYHKLSNNCNINPTTALSANSEVKAVDAIFLLAQRLAPNSQHYTATTLEIVVTTN